MLDVQIVKQYYSVWLMMFIKYYCDKFYKDPFRRLQHVATSLAGEGTSKMKLIPNPML